MLYPLTFTKNTGVISALLHHYRDSSMSFSCLGPLQGSQEESGCFIWVVLQKCFWLWLQPQAHIPGPGNPSLHLPSLSPCLKLKPQRYVVPRKCRNKERHGAVHRAFHAAVSCSWLSKMQRPPEKQKPPAHTHSAFYRKARQDWHSPVIGFHSR